jgi:hypothetical protein
MTKEGVKKKVPLALGLSIFSFLIAFPTFGGYVENLTIVYVGVAALAIYSGIMAAVGTVRFGRHFVTAGLLVSLLMGLLTYLFYTFVQSGVWAGGSVIGQISWALTYIIIGRSLKIRSELYKALTVGLFQLTGQSIPETLVTGRVLGGNLVQPITLVNVPLIVLKWFTTCAIQALLWVSISKLRKQAIQSTQASTLKESP